MECQSYAALLDQRIAALTDDAVCRTKDIPKVYLRLRRMVRKEKPDLVLALPEKVNELKEGWAEAVRRTLTGK